MRFTIAGHEFDLDPVSARARLSGHPPENLQVHWVEHEERRWPPKQALEVISGLERSAYRTSQALNVLRRLGFTTSDWAKAPKGGPVRARRPEQLPELDPQIRRDRLHQAVDSLADFMGSQGLTARVADLEARLKDSSSETVSSIVNSADVNSELIRAALTVRGELGRLNDVIHAAVICLTLPLILDDGETVSVRPSLAAGNDPGRPFDLETTHRVAEFKVSVWRGADAMRKRGAFVDLVHLALDQSPRRKQLFVVGSEPERFLNTATSPVSWGFSRGSARLRSQFEERFGSLDTTISQFRSGAGSVVEIVDLRAVLPELKDWIP